MAFGHFNMNPRGSPRGINATWDSDTDSVPVLKELPNSLSSECYERLLDRDPTGDGERDTQVHPNAPLHRAGKGAQHRTPRGRLVLPSEPVDKEREKTAMGARKGAKEAERAAE